MRIRNTYFSLKQFLILKNIYRVICICNQIPGEDYTRESIRIPKFVQFF